MEPFYVTASWVDEGELLLQTQSLLNTRLDTKHIDKSLEYIESTIQRFEIFFQSYPQRREIFYNELSKKIDTYEADENASSQETIDLLLLLKNRFDDLSAVYHTAISHLLFIQGYYRLLEFLSELKAKLRLWNHATSRSLTKRWMAEYTVIFC